MEKSIIVRCCLNILSTLHSLLSEKRLLPHSYLAEIEDFSYNEI